jgi:hypothetical protein
MAEYRTLGISLKEVDVNIVEPTNMNMLVMNRINRKDSINGVTTTLFSSNQFETWVEDFCLTEGVSLDGHTIEDYINTVHSYFALCYDFDVFIEVVDIENITDFKHTIF